MAAEAVAVDARDPVAARRSQPCINNRVRFGVDVFEPELVASFAEGIAVALAGHCPDEIDGEAAVTAGGYWFGDGADLEKARTFCRWCSC